MAPGLFHVPAILVLCLSAASGHLAGDVDTELLNHVLDRVQALENRNQVLEDKNKALEEKVTYQQSEIDTLQRKMMSLRNNLDVEDSMSRESRLIFDSTEGPVAFTARLDSLYIDNMVTNQTVIFEHQVLDTADYYDTNSGEFTAPRSGIYMFSCSILDALARRDGSGVMVHAEIMQERRTLARVFAHADGSDNRDQGAQTIVVQVQKGERVYVRVIDATDLQLGGDMYSTFSGYLLWPL